VGESRSKPASSYPDFGGHRPNYVYSKRELEPMVPKLSVRGRMIVSNALLSEVLWFGWVGVFVGRDLVSVYVVDPRMVENEKITRLSNSRKVDIRIPFVDTSRNRPFGEVNIGGVHGSRHLDIARYRNVERLYLVGRFVGFRFAIDSDKDISTRSRKPDNWIGETGKVDVQITVEPLASHWAEGDGISVVEMKKRLGKKTVSRYGLTYPKKDIIQKEIESARRIKKLEREIEHLQNGDYDIG
jgi:hypothetical protein